MFIWVARSSLVNSRSNQAVSEAVSWTTVKAAERIRVKKPRASRVTAIVFFMVLRLPQPLR